MKLIIAEKPELARAIAEYLDGNNQSKNGYIVCANDYVVTWCYGHMYQLFEPEDYDEKLSKWSLDDLPFFHTPWKRKVVDEKKKQVETIFDLYKKADLIIHAGDPDDEGQLLIDELLNEFHNSKPVKRLLVNDYNPELIGKAFNEIKDNSEFIGLGKSAEARSVADQLYGCNLSRLFTLLCQNAGYSGVISIGRVQTPVLGLVVKRDLENRKHIKTYYYSIFGQFNIEGIEFSAKYKAKEEEMTDGKILDEGIAKKITQELNNKKATVINSITKSGKSPKKLPYNLLELQKDCSKQFKYSPKQVKQITQDLREKHKLITYNRSDCQYLHEEDHQFAPRIIDAILENTSNHFEPYIKELDTSIKSRAFDSSKVSAHHAIVPTFSKKNINNLNNEEKNIYLLICRAYLAQFLPDDSFEKTTLAIKVEDKEFSATSKIIKSLGWKILYKNSSDTSEGKEENISAIDLSCIKNNSLGICISGNYKELETKPLPLYTMDTLLDDFKRVAKYVKNDKLRDLLIKKDEGKEGEHGGIGTPATRDEIISNLLNRGLITEEKGKIISTAIGQKIYNLLPDIVRYPDMTALWYEQQVLISQNKLDINDFLGNVYKFIETEVAAMKNRKLDLQIEQFFCPNCQSSLKRLKGKNGFFWICTNPDKDVCHKTFNDENGKPLLNDFSKNFKKGKKGNKLSPFNI